MVKFFKSIFEEAVSMPAAYGQKGAWKFHQIPLLSVAEVRAEGRRSVQGTQRERAFPDQ